MVRGTIDKELISGQTEEYFLQLVVVEPMPNVGPSHCRPVAEIPPRACFAFPSEACFPLLFSNAVVMV